MLVLAIKASLASGGVVTPARESYVAARRDLAVMLANSFNRGDR